MKQGIEDRNLKTCNDRIEGNIIIIDSEGEFPKKVIVQENGQRLEYSLIKTRKGKYLLN
jgi:hemin uptake protein HemP